MGRTRPSDILVALDRIYTHKERKDKVEADTALSLMQFQLRTDAREDEQDFQRETIRMKTKLDLETNYPGITFKEDGITPNFETYNLADSLPIRVSNMTTTLENLKMWNLSTAGTDDQLIKREGIYRQGMVKGQNIMAPSISPGVAIRAGYDASPGRLTQQDFLDFEAQYEGAGGADSPIALQQLIDAGIISADILYTEDNPQGFDENGLLVADEAAKDNIAIALQGLKKGIQANQNYMSNLKYEEHLASKRQENLLFAESAVGSPGVIRASRLYESAAKGIGGNYIAYDATTPIPTMLWQGERMQLDEIGKSIQKNKSISPEDRGKLETFVSTLMGVTADGQNLGNVLETLNADIDLSGKSRMLILLNKINPGLSRALTGALKQYNNIERVSRLAERYIHAPEDVTERSDFRQLITDTGLSQALQKYRTADVSGQDVEELGIQIDEIVAGIQSQIRNKYPKEGTDAQKKAMKKELDNFFLWMDLEEATSELYKESAKRRRK